MKMYMNEIIYLKPYHFEFTFKNFSFQCFPFFACFAINILNAPIQCLQRAFIFFGTKLLNDLSASM